MIDIFKNWISAMLCIGIFITIVQLIMPKTNLRKYIYTLIGIVTILTVLSPIVNILKNETMEQSIQDVISNISNDENNSNINIEKYKNAKEEAVKEGFIESVKKDIKTKLTAKAIAVNKVEIFIDGEYNIEKIEVYIKKLNQSSTLDSVNKIVKYINEEYDIEYSKIVVIEDGE